MILNNHIYNEHAPSRLLVYGLIASIIAICLVTIPYAHHHWPHLPAFVPLFAAFVMIIETLTAYLLIIQFRVSHQAHLVPLAGAYAFVAVMVTLQLLSFPGVFGENGILQGTNQSAVWMWVFWHGAFATLISLSLCLQLKYPDRKLSFRSGIGAFILAPFGKA